MKERDHYSDRIYKSFIIELSKAFVICEIIAKKDEEKAINLVDLMKELYRG